MSGGRGFDTNHFYLHTTFKGSIISVIQAFNTTSGEEDLVDMDLATFARRESMLRLREALIASEEDRLAGKTGYSIDEVASMMRQAIREVKGVEGTGV